MPIFGGAKTGKLFEEFSQASKEGKPAAVKNGGGGREDICVFSLRHGTGTSFMSAGIANFLANHRKGVVSLVLNDTMYAEEIASAKVNTVSWVQEAEVFNRSDYIVHDIGMYGDLSADRRNALQRASLKILLCKGDGAYLSRLAEFVESGVIDTENVVFLFNELPSEWEKKVYDLMDFTNMVYCVPTFYPLVPSAQVVKVMNDILKKR